MDGVWRRRAILFALTLAVVVVKAPTLSTPFFWDEMSWAGAAQWLHQVGVVHALPGLHPPAKFFGHPPALYVSGALLFAIFGQTITVAHVLILAFAVLGVGATFRLGEELFDAATGVLAAVLLFLSPLYLAQSGMFLGDLPVAALGVTCVVLALRGRFVPYLATASYMLLVKETALAFVAAVVVYLWLRARDTRERRRALLYALPLVAAGAYMLGQQLSTGHPAVIYNEPFPFIEGGWQAMLVKLDLITRWLFLRQGRFLLGGLIVLALCLRRDAWCRELVALGVFVVACSYPFVVIYFLPRYLLPALPYVYLAGAASLAALVRDARWRTLVAACLVLLAVHAAPVSQAVGNREFDLGYLDVVAVHQEVARYLEASAPDALILTAFPHHRELSLPALGYVRRPLRVERLGLDAGDEGADVILSSTTSDPDGTLQRLATLRGYRIVHTVSRAGVTAVVYARSPAVMTPAVKPSENRG